MDVVLKGGAHSFAALEENDLEACTNFWYQEDMSGDFVGTEGSDRISSALNLRCHPMQALTIEGITVWLKSATTVATIDGYSPAESQTS